MKILKTLFLLSVNMLSIGLQAQEQKKIDSLSKALKSMPNDTVKVKVYGHLCRSYAIAIGDFDMANKYLDSVKMFSDQLKYENGIIHSFFLDGLINYQSGNYDKALNGYKKANQQYLKIGDSFFILCKNFYI